MEAHGLIAPCMAPQGVAILLHQSGLCDSGSRLPVKSMVPIALRHMHIWPYGSMGGANRTQFPTPTPPHLAHSPECVVVDTVTS